MKHLGNIILVMLFVAVLTALFGRYRPFIVMSDSMYPTLKKNDVIIGERVTEGEVIRIGEIYTYAPRGRFYLVTHRIVNKTEDGYIFKGDSNENADSVPVCIDQIRYRIVKLGLECIKSVL